MVLPYLLEVLVCSAMLVVVGADNDANSLSGTWSSKSNQVFTGPGFYDPIDELLIEPALPGISYSFTEDGYFEEATYQVGANAKDPGCPNAALIYQHGSYEIFSNGSLVLTPIEIDGRRLYSDPCNDNGVSVYSRYNQTELFLSFDVSIDDYHGRYKLQLYAFDGAPLQPLYLSYRPPMMLPTNTLNPVTTVVEDGKESTAKVSSSSSQKRSLKQLIKRNLENKHKTNAKRITFSFYSSEAFWYLSTAMIGIGSLLFLLC